jgi:hypothetical protein
VADGEVRAILYTVVVGIAIAAHHRYVRSNVLMLIPATVALVLLMVRTVVLPYPEWSENVNHINLGNKQSGLDINATFLEDGYCTNRFHGLGSKIL